jgi:hypothetical protein
MANKKFGIDFASLKAEGYRNINELYKQNNQLHACETLFGDWDAEVMILAQDAANFNTLKQLKASSDENPFKHSPKNRTNKNLYEIIRSLEIFKTGEYDMPNNKKCGLYYANAIWLLKDTDGMSGSLTNTKEAYKENKKVFDATISNLPRLKLILTLGEHAFNFIKFCSGDQISIDWHQSVQKRKLSKAQIGNKSLLVGSIYHTSNRGMIARSRRDGYDGDNPCARGIAITKKDIKEIFSGYIKY